MIRKALAAAVVAIMLLTASSAGMWAEELTEEIIEQSTDELQAELQEEPAGQIQVDGLTGELLSEDEALLLAEDFTGGGLIVDMSPQAGSVSGQDIADFACQFVGNPYVYGGTSLTDGCDCSGFVLSVFGAFDIDLPHYSGAQFYYGVSVNPEILMPGDLVFYGPGGSYHVAIYIGDGQIVHAAGKNVGIIISRMYGRPSGYRRLV